jgi:HEAT repeat protein
MKDHKCLMTGCSMLLLVLGVLNCAVAEDDPQIGDKPLSELLKQLRSENRGLQVRAARALTDAPAELKPAMMPKVMPLLKSERENDKFVAAQVLGDCGPQARSAVQDLLPMLKGTQYERNRAAAAKALGQILKDAKPDKEVDEVTAALTATFKDAYEDVRREAVTACGMIGPAAKACIPNLKPLLEEPPGATPNMVSMAAAGASERMGPLAREHTDLLITLMHRYASDQTPAYVLALRAIGPIQDNIVQNVMSRMETIGWGGCMEACVLTLETFGPKAEASTDLLARFIREWKTDAKGMTKMARALKAIGPGAKNAEKTLRDLLALPYHYRPGSYQLENAADWAEMKRTTAAALEAITGQKVAVTNEVQKGNPN